jgi:transcriptional regulator with XRE-family HTH domain
VPLSSIEDSMNEKRDKKRIASFGKRLRFVRERVVGISQDELASRCDINKYKISLIENGKNDFYYTTFLELLKGLELSEREFFEIEIA